VQAGVIRAHAAITTPLPSGGGDPGHHRDQSVLRRALGLPRGALALNREESDALFMTRQINSCVPRKFDHQPQATD
jgi:hypothetical protein